MKLQTNENYSISKEEIRTIIQQVYYKNRTRKEVRDEFGNIFQTMGEAAAHYNVSYYIIGRKIKNPDYTTQTKLPKLYSIDIVMGHK
jgi:hypothetical protein